MQSWNVVAREKDFLTKFTSYGTLVCLLIDEDDERGEFENVPFIFTFLSLQSLEYLVYSFSTSLIIILGSK